MLGERIDAETALRLGLVNRVVPADQLLAVAEETAMKLAALPQRAVRGNKFLVNRAYELAGFSQALEYRGDPAYQALQSDAGGEELNEHLRVLREQGWEAFRRSRDAIYRETEAHG